MAEEREEVDMSCDLISSLPDDIIVSIISRLDSFRELLATALLSRQWRTFWTLSPSINFDFSEEQHRPDVVLSHLLSCHRRHLSTCRISHLAYSGNMVSWFPPDKLDSQWITHLTLKRITNLTLSYNPSFNTDPSEILTIPSLEELTLSDYYLDAWQPPTHGILLPRLRSLRLKRVSLLEQALSTLIAGAPLLERLGLSNCYSYQHVRIHSQVLKVLEIDRQKSVITLDIDTPTVTTLVLHGWIIYLKINCPSLSSLSTTCVYAEDHVEDKQDKLIRRWRRLEILKIDDMEILELICGFDARCKEDIPSPFSNVRNNPSCFAGLCKLSIGINIKFHKHARVLRFILNRCTHLQELRLAQDVRHKLAFISIAWPMFGTFTCLEQHLKQLWITSFTGAYLEQEFIKYVLSSASMLKRLVISYHDICTTDSLEALKLALPKARTYPNLNLIIKKDGYTLED